MKNTTQQDTTQQDLEKMIQLRNWMMALTEFVGRPNHTKALNEINKVIESLSK